MQTLFVPQSKSGIWASVLGVLFFVLLAVRLADVVRLPIPAFGLFGLGVVAMGLAVYAMARRHERSLWAFLAIAGGVLVIVWTTAELLGPAH